MYSKTSLLPTLCNRVQQRTSGLVGWLASSIRRMRTGNSSLSESWIKTSAATTATRNNKNHAVCLLLFWLRPHYQQQQSRVGRIRGRGREKEPRVELREREREKHHTEIKVGGLEGWAHSRLFPCVWCVVEHELGGGLTSVDRHAGQRAGWLFLRRWTRWRDGNRQSA